MDNKEDDTLKRFVYGYAARYNKLYEKWNMNYNGPQRKEFVTARNELRQVLTRHDALPIVITPETLKTMMFLFETEGHPKARAVFTELYVTSIKQKLTK